MTALIRQAEEALIRVPHHLEQTTGGTRMIFPAGQDSDYHFEGWLSGDEEFLEINAVLNDIWQRRFPGHQYFWYQPFERLDLDLKEPVLSDWLDTLCLLLTHDTKIYQTKGWFWWSFTCFYLQDGRWIRLFGNSALRRSRFNVPQITQRKQWYQAKAVVGPGLFARS